MSSMSNERPAYRILALHGFFGPDDNLYPEGAEIYYDDEPNEEMEPLNEPARVRLTAFIEKLDALGKAVAEKTNRPFVGRPRTLDGAVALASELERNKTAIMSAPKDVTSVTKIEKDPVPEVGNVGRKKSKPLPLSRVS